jgi:hypothetical protein
VFGDVLQRDELNKKAEHESFIDESDKASKTPEELTEGKDSKQV